MYKIGAIHVLDKNVAELIAAGEVIERPSSVIKELVENAIDAKASCITVEIKNGGVTYMRVTDDGCGMSKDDVSLSFLRHATSKIELKDDLNHIDTLGFRGEALASICAVSKVQVLTRTESMEIGTQYKIEGGEEKLIEDVGCPKGTSFIVRDIFYNVPARMKFLKKDVTEGNHIAAIMDRIALSHPEIKFAFIRDGRQIMKTSGNNNLKEAVLQVFGKEFSGTLLPVDDKYNNIKVTGYISKPENSRPNRSMQLFFINGRYVRSITAMTALENAYKGVIMTGKFPACVLKLEMSCDALDVNVHPAKLEVRFTNERPVFESVYHSVKSAIGAFDIRKPEQNIIDKAKNYGTPSVLFSKADESPSQLSFTLSQKPYMTVNAKNESYVEKNNKPIGLSSNPTETFEDNEFEIFVPKSENCSRAALSDVADIASVYKNLLNLPPTSSRTENCLNVQSISNDKIKSYEDEKTENLKTEETIKIIDEDEEIPFRLIGEAFSLYIILEYGNDYLMFIDKHAAHERILYEQLKKQTPESCAQILLEPITVTLDKKEYDAVLQNLDVLMKAGFEVEAFGVGSIIIRSVPQLLDKIDICETFMEIAGFLVQHRQDLFTEKMEWLFQNTACRAAVKSGDYLHQEELIYLAMELEKNRDIKYCPHGRPIYFLMSKKELEHKFMRIT